MPIKIVVEPRFGDFQAKITDIGKSKFSDVLRASSTQSPADAVAQVLRTSQHELPFQFSSERLPKGNGFRISVAGVNGISGDGQYVDDAIIGWLEHGGAREFGLEIQVQQPISNGIATVDGTFQLLQASLGTQYLKKIT